ncbi:hypothetical protein JCM11641_001786 [Rhodosporidiobolus odoratus]
MPGLLKPQPSSVRAQIDFLDPLLTEKPFSCLGAPPPGMPATNIEPYSIGIRRKKHNAPSAGSARTPENTGPVSRAHNDNTPATGARRVMLEMGEEAEELSKGRCQVCSSPFFGLVDVWHKFKNVRAGQIVNVWRPLAYPAQDCPLAYMDYRTLNVEQDLRATDLILSNEGNRKGENYSVLHNPAQKWYFLSNQTPEECIVFKIYDSLNEPGIAQLTPHSAFVNPTAPHDTPPRQSIEIRALVFY